MTDTESISVLLAGVPLFAELADDLRATLVSVAVIEEVDDGAFLFREGDVGDRWYVVVEGAIDIVRTVREGDSERHLHLTTLAAGDSFGEISVFDAKPRSAAARAHGATRLVALERDALEKLLKERPAEVARLLVAMIGTLSSTIRRSTQDLVTVYETGKTAGSERELDRLSVRILERVHAAVGATRSALGIWNPYVEDYDWSFHGEGGEVDDAHAFGDELAEFIGAAFEAGDAVEVHGDGSGWLGRSGMVVPIWSEDEGLGVLVCVSDRDGAIGPNQRRLAGIVALQVGGAIAIARHEQDRRDRERLERAREGFGGPL